MRFLFCLCYDFRIYHRFFDILPLKKWSFFLPPMNVGWTQRFATNKQNVVEVMLWVTKWIASILPSTFWIAHSQFSSVQPLSCVRLFATPWTAKRQPSLSITNSQSLLKLMSIESVMPSNHLILCWPLLLPSVFPRIGVFSYESVLHVRWPKIWSFSFGISACNEYTRWISFRMGLLNFLAVQGALKSLLQHHSSKASILWLSAFFTVQLSHSVHMTGWTCVGKVMSLIFTVLSR